MKGEDKEQEGHNKEIEAPFDQCNQRYHAGGDKCNKDDTDAVGISKSCGLFEL